jgi:hypothetical protein
MDQSVTSEVIAATDTTKHIPEVLAMTLETHAHWMAEWRAAEADSQIQGVAESLITASFALADHVRSLSPGDPILAIFSRFPLAAYDAFPGVGMALFDYVFDTAPIVPAEVLDDLLWLWASTAVQLDGCDCDEHDSGDHDE